MEQKGVIYILTNPSFPQYVKIGYADNVESRLKQLNNSECIPFAFRIYATYEVEERLTDLKLHALIDQLNPNLRSIDNVDGKKPLGEFVREIVGLDMAAAKAAFAQYLNDVSLDADQIYFVNQIIEYIVRNGVMKDMSVLQEPPFTDRGSIVEVFTDISVWLGIRNVIEKINANATA